MALNDRLMLPKIMLDMADLKDLLQAEQQEFDFIVSYIESQFSQLFIATCTELGRLEKTLGIQTDISLSLDARRRQIVSRITSRCPATPANLIALAETLSGNPCSLRESYTDYTLEISIYLNHTLLNPIDVILRILQLFIPAHLCISIRLGIKTRTEFSVLHTADADIGAKALTNPDVTLLDGTRVLNSAWQLNNPFAVFTVNGESEEK